MIFLPLQGCVAILSIAWILCLTLFGVMVLPKGNFQSTVQNENNLSKGFITVYYVGYYFNSTGLLVCEPFYSKASYRILATCALYFPTTMILMYCYGSSFHSSRFRLAAPTMQQTPITSQPTAEKVIQY